MRHGCARPPSVRPLVSIPEYRRWKKITQGIRKTGLLHRSADFYGYLLHPSFSAPRPEQEVACQCVRHNLRELQLCSGIGQPRNTGKTASAFYKVSPRYTRCGRCRYRRLKKYSSGNRVVSPRASRDAVAPVLCFRAGVIAEIQERGIGQRGAVHPYERAESLPSPAGRGLSGAAREQACRTRRPSGDQRNRNCIPAETISTSTLSSS